MDEDIKRRKQSPFSFCLFHCHPKKNNIAAKLSTFNMHILIIGCGLAGLTTSIALAKGGHTVEILESSAHISYIGAGIQITPNASKVLRRLDIDSYIKKYCSYPVDLRMMRWKDGQVLVECPLEEPAENVYMSPYWLVIVSESYNWTKKR